MQPIVIKVSILWRLKVVSHLSLLRQKPLVRQSKPPSTNKSFPSAGNLSSVWLYCLLEGLPIPTKELQLWLKYLKYLTRLRQNLKSGWMCYLFRVVTFMELGTQLGRDLIQHQSKSILKRRNDKIPWIRKVTVTVMWPTRGTEGLDPKSWCDQQRAPKNDQSNDLLNV